MATVGPMGTTLPHLDRGARDYPDDDYDAYDDYDDYDAQEGDTAGSEAGSDYTWTGWPAEIRWRPAAAIVGAVLAVGAIATAVIINSGDSASTKATVGAPVPRTVPSATTTAKASAPPSASTVPQLPPETVTTVTPSAGPSTLATAPPTAVPPLAPTAVPPAATLDPRTVVYSVTGSKQLLDLVNVTYTDARGYPQTEFNVSLPWSRMIVLNPGVQNVSVVATSFYARLNCSVVNAAGQTVVASAANSNLATCTR
ncbi:putative threonine and proline rich protein [Mycobacterium bohemicum DSM 44277]|nr:putative threonine and proline rich protein [Mycobacterium bohemicum DSM 44277]